MTKNSLAVESAASDPPPSKRQKLEPSPSVISETVATPSTPLHDPVHVEVTMVDTIAASEELAREVKAGIGQFVNPGRKGFTGILKQRYTDFMVNEITLDGSVLHLKNDQAQTFMPLPSENKIEATPELERQARSLAQQSVTETAEEMPVPTEVVQTKDSPRKEEQRNDIVELREEPIADFNALAFSLSPEDDAILVEYFGTEFKDKILQFHEKILAKPTAKPNYFGSILSEPFTDRVRRGRLHGDVRRIFKSRLETTSVDGGNIKFTAASQAVVKNHGKISRTPQNQNQGGRAQRVSQAKGKLGWDELGGQYLHFTLLKENKDTMEVLGYLARAMKIKPKDFAFSGTKDRRAVTVQRVSVFRQHAKDLAKLNPNIRQARIGDFKYEKHSLKLGQLNGNFFTISLRDCHFDGEEGLGEEEKFFFAEQIVKEAANHFKEDGFINYFGLQRFGTFTISNDVVGAQILNGNFEGAIKSILHYNPDLLHGDPNTESRVGRDDIARARAIHEFETSCQSKGALDQLPRRFYAEASIIRHLGNRNNKQDYLGALGTIQRNLKTMYVHAYQSLVWNTAASERWVRYGAEVVEGDLVLIEASENDAVQATKDEFDENGEIIVLPTGDDFALQADEKFERARPLSAEEAMSGKYSIFDIVLPTPGFDVEYPLNSIGDFYKEYMSSERGGGLDPANMRRPQKDFSLSGNYRKLLARAEDLSFTVKRYHEDTEQLTETDLDILDKGRFLSHGNGQQRHGKNVGYKQREDSHNNKGKFDRSKNDSASRFTRDVRFENPDFLNTKATNETPSEILSTTLSDGSTTAADDHKAQQAAALRAWNALPAKLGAEQKAASDEWLAKRAANGDFEHNSTSSAAPQVRETYIQTSVTVDGRRKVKGRTTAVLGSAGDNNSAVTEFISPRELAKSEVSQTAPELAESEDIKSEGAKSTTQEMETGGISASADVVDDSAISLDSSGGVRLEPKIAVIIKFALGTSQYATMALRELLKAGGLTLTSLTLAWAVNF